MLKARCGKFFSRSCVQAFGPVAFALASALLAASSPAADSRGGTTVFTNQDGSAWTVAVRPAQRSVRPAGQAVAVPALPELKLEDAAATEPEHVFDNAVTTATLATTSGLTVDVDAETISDAAPQSRMESVAFLQPEPPPELPEPETDEFGIVVRPAPSRTLNFDGRTYEKAYRSIPYRQAEYLANPGYRHDAAMELLFGELRPTTIVRQSAPQTVVNPRVPLYRPYWVTPSEFWSSQRRFPYFGSPLGFGPPTGCVWPE